MPYACDFSGRIMVDVFELCNVHVHGRDASSVPLSCSCPGCLTYVANTRKVMQLLSRHLIARLIPFLLISSIPFIMLMPVLSDGASYMSSMPHIP